MTVKLFTSPFLNNGLKKSVLTTLILISLFFCSCNTDSNVMKQYYTMTDINKNIHDITSAVYTDVEIDDIVNNQYDIHSLNEKYPVECVRYRSKYHVCYIVKSLKEEIRKLKHEGCILIQDICYAELLKSNICFLYTTDRKVIELVEDNG